MRGITWELGSCVYSDIDEDGFAVAQPEAYGDDPRVAPYALHHPFGFACQPLDPDVDPDGKPLEGKACTMLVGHQGHQRHAMAFGDPRGIDLYPRLKKGGSVQYAAVRGADGVIGSRKSFDIHDGENGTKTVYVEYLDGETLKAHQFIVGVDGNGAPYVEVTHGDGQGLVLMSRNAVLRNASGNAYLQVGDDGIVINGNFKAVGAADINGFTISPTGGAKTALGVDLDLHVHPTGIGPTGPATPTP